MKITIGAVVLTTASLVACAGPQASGTFQTHASYDRVFSAAMAALPAVGFHATSINHAEGTIIAEQNVIMGGGAAVGLTAEVSRRADLRTLTATFVAPPGTFALGGFGQNVDQYIGAIRVNVPDLQAAR